MTHPLFKRLFLTDKTGYKDWVRAELECHRPVLFIPSLGVPIRGSDVYRRLRAVTAAV